MIIAPVMRTKFLLLITCSRTSLELPAFQGRGDFTTERARRTADASSRVNTACRERSGEWILECELGLRFDELPLALASGNLSIAERSDGSHQSAIRNR
jgi:hypothetical protein